MPARKLKAVESPPDQATPQYDLEPLSDDARSRLNVWGNSTQVTIEQLREDFPNWAQLLEDIFVTVGGAIRSQDA